jgi:prepilin-type N-terminal cleavage/methylation domain-containing protein
MNQKNNVTVMDLLVNKSLTSRRFAIGQGKAVCFTLIELLVVIAIIAILASMLL